MNGVLGRLTTAELEELRASLPRMTLEERAELSQLLTAVVPAPPAITFRQFVADVKPEYRWWWYNDMLHDRLMDVAEGRIKNLAVFMPPRAGKSETISKLFIAYFMYRFPFKWAGLASYNAELAFFLARQAREYYLKAGGSVHASRDEDSSRQWESAGRGGLWAAGVGGSITGRGAHLLVLDDPLKNAEEAASEVIRHKLIEWWQSTWTTRQEPNCAKIMVMTRWHPNDVAGWVFEQEKAAHANGSHEGWHIVNFEAIRTEEPYEVPPGSTLEPDPRPTWNARDDHEAAALNPDRYPMRELLRIRARVGSYYWNAMYQGRPKAKEGHRIKSAWLKVVDAVPSSVRARVRFWDLAGTDKKDAENESHDPDFSVGLRMSWGTDGIFYIEDVQRGQWSPGTRNARMRVTADADAEKYGRLGFETGFETEAGVDGEARTRDIFASLAGHQVYTERAAKSKETRLEPFAAQAEAGNVRLVKGLWNAPFIDEVCSFPYGAHDDTADAASGAMRRLTGGGDFLLAPPESVGVASPYAV